MNGLPCQLSLLITGDRFLFRPRDEKNGKMVLAINRNSGKLSILESFDKSSLLRRGSSVELEKNVELIIGIAHSLESDQSYLIIASSRSLIGEIDGKRIWKITTFEIIDFEPKTKRKKKKVEDKFKDMLVQVLSTPFFYFSYDYDLTHTKQRIQDFEENSSLSLYKRADTRFIWNYNLLRDFECCPAAADIERFLVPLVHGAVFIHHCRINAISFKWSLVSRRSRFRVGTRFFSRGADDVGNVSNFVETEQIVEYNDAVSSFVQTRGSIPLLWNQTPNIRYKPKPQLSPKLRDHTNSANFHFNHQIGLYGAQVIVNLVNQSGPESPMESHFKKISTTCLGNASKVRYVAFDFHSECKAKNGGWNQLKKLINQLLEDLNSHGYFFSRKKSVENRQTGVFRTNCMDCLDRTNVVQSLLATENLKAVFLRLGILRPGQNILDQFQFQDIYKNTWADNADLISLQYSGTGALKTDFTRTGVRTKWGLLQDGWNSAIRYYKNNFTDGFRQDSLDYFVGGYRHIPSLSVKTKLTPEEQLISFLPYMLLGVLSILVLCLIFMSQMNSNNFLLITLLSLMSGLIFNMILQNGYFFVSFPTGYNRHQFPALQNKPK